MSSKVEVLCPNGHKVYVKTTPNTKLVQILEEACAKQGFMPPDDYELTHIQSRKTLDLTLTIRFAGLPNNAKLELTKATKCRISTKVVVALQLPSGQRLKAEFEPTDNVWSVLQHFEKENPELFAIQTSEQVTDAQQQQQQHPVCVYLREEVVGQYAMQETTLRDLGLLSGSGVLRLLYKQVEQSVLDEIEESIKKEKLKRERIAKKASASVTQSSGAGTVDSGTSDEVSMEVEEPMLERQSSSGEQDRMITEDNISTDANQRTAVSDNVSNSLSDSEVPSRCFPQFPTTGMFSRDQPTCGARLKEACSTEQSALPLPSEPLFKDFKFPEETKGQDLYKNELESEKELQKWRPCERNMICYSIEDTKLPKVDSVDPDDEFFELTESDVRKMYADLQQQLREEEQADLMTQAMRKARAVERLARYDHVFIRFTFPDKVVIQATFRPKEPVYNLYKFIKEQLRDRSMSFQLYTSPPKHVLKDQTLTLIEADLVPMTVVYFSCDEKMAHYLSEDVLLKVSSQMDANRKIVDMMNHPVKRQADSEAKILKLFKAAHS